MSVITTLKKQNKKKTFYATGEKVKFEPAGAIVVP